MISVVYCTREDNSDYINHIKNTISVKDYEIIQIVIKEIINMYE